MKIYDISQQIFGCEVYPGDKGPSKFDDMRISRGDLYNLTSIEMGVHNGTHIDAPFHFIDNGDTIEKIPLEKTCGYCYVSEENRDVDAKRARAIIDIAAALNIDSSKRILIKGSGEITADAARVFAESDIYLLGVEGQSVGPKASPAEVHKILLAESVVLLEGLCLSNINEGVYFLSSAPILLEGIDGAPCRAVLLEG